MDYKTSEYWDYDYPDMKAINHPAHPLYGNKKVFVEVERKVLNSLATPKTRLSVRA